VRTAIRNNNALSNLNDIDITTQSARAVLSQIQLGSRSRADEVVASDKGERLAAIA
jgi:hypothetical protein